MTHEHADRSRLLAKLVRSLLASEHFDSLSDLTDALKFRCARLRIDWTADDIGTAFRLIASNRRLPGLPLAAPRRVERLDEVPVTRADAAAILRRLGVTL